MSTNAELYDQDFYAWTQSTAELIRTGKWYDLDRDALAEEIESLGKSDWRELASRLAVLLRHLLKWRYQPEKWQRGRSWSSTIWEQRSRPRRVRSAMSERSYSATAPRICKSSWSCGSWLMGRSRNSTWQPCFWSSSSRRT